MDPELIKQLIARLFGRETPDVGRLEPVQARTDPASLFKQDPFFTDTLQSLAPASLHNVPTLDQNTLAAVNTNFPDEILLNSGRGPLGKGPLNESSPERRQATLAHESGHVVDLGGKAPGLSKAVAESFPIAQEAFFAGKLGGNRRVQQVHSIKNEREHFASAFQNAMDFIRGTPGTLYENRRFDWNSDDAEEVLPGTKPIIEWLATQGFKRPPMVEGR